MYVCMYALTLKGIVVSVLTNHLDEKEKVISVNIRRYLVGAFLKL